MKKTLRIAVMGLLIVLMSSLTACGYNVPSDMVAVHVGEGPFEAKKVKGCIDSSKRAFMTNDTYALFPTSEREWDATGQKGSDSARFSSVTKDNVEMAVPVTIRFTLITDCKTLKDFYQRYARRYGVEFSSDGSYNDAWLTLLRKLVADPSDTTLDRIIQDYNWRDVWNNPETKTEIERRLNEALAGKSSLMDVVAKGHFFESISVLVGKAEPKNKELAAAVATEQTKVAQAQSDEAQAKADRAKALAQVAVAQAEAEKKRAEIAGYKSVDDYLKAKCIEAGCNPFQPSYVWGGNSQ